MSLSNVTVNQPNIEPGHYSVIVVG
ncbi:MAG: hypothetical protein QOF46_1719, partial [Paraburkholderia sp.]|nr:hypothetical protein [Paraburkholderia sp.]